MTHAFWQRLYGVQVSFLFVPDWLGAKGRSRDFEYEVLDKLLQKFYAEVRDKKGATYMKATYISMRYGISRNIRGPPFYRKSDITKDRDYMKSNKAFNGMLRQIKLNVKDVITHKSAVSDEDWQNLSWRWCTYHLNAPRRRSLLISRFWQKWREGVSDLRKDSITCLFNYLK